ncbi:Facilitated trehalose transporter Tret1 [Blattella germanica]|nr:Facilitated trehalose transporter Tret1 [Blattella germanica]
MGRRLVLLLMAIPMFIGWMMIVVADHSIPLLYAARFIQGFTCGVITVASPLYSEEIAETEIRGTLGVYLDLMFNVGILYVYVLGAAFPYLWMSIISTALPVIFAITFFWMPESPIYLLSKGRVAKAEKALCRLRGTPNRRTASIDEEFKQMQKFIKRTEVSASRRNESCCGSISDFFRSFSISFGTLKAMNIIFGLMIFRQISGMNAILAYTVEIFQVAGSSLDPHLCTVIVGVIQLIATFLPYFIVDLAGRRILLILSGAGMGVCLLAMVVRFYLLREGIEIAMMGWLPLVAVNLYIIACSVGFGPLPWFMMPELLSNEAKSWVSSTAVCLNWALAFVVTKFFPVMMNDMGSEATYLTFFVICLVGTLFVIVFVPETKGKSREQIQNELNGVPVRY